MCEYVWLRIFAPRFNYYFLGVVCKLKDISTLFSLRIQMLACVIVKFCLFQVHLLIFKLADAFLYFFASAVRIWR